MDDFTEIDGIGRTRAGRLQDMGLTTFADLAAVDPAALAAFLGVSETYARALTAAAAGLTAATAVSPADDGAPTPPAIYLLTGAKPG